MIAYNVTTWIFYFFSSLLFLFAVYKTRNDRNITLNTICVFYVIYIVIGLIIQTLGIVEITYFLQDVQTILLINLIFSYNKWLLAISKNKVYKQENLSISQKLKNQKDLKILHTIDLILNLFSCFLITALVCLNFMYYNLVSFFILFELVTCLSLLVTAFFVFRFNIKLASYTALLSISLLFYFILSFLINVLSPIFTKLILVITLYMFACAIVFACSYKILKIGIKEDKIK